eukprot:gene12070-biopygen3404
MGIQCGQNATGQAQNTTQWQGHAFRAPQKAGPCRFDLTSITCRPAVPAPILRAVLGAGRLETDETELMFELIGRSGLWLAWPASRVSPPFPPFGYTLLGCEGFPPLEREAVLHKGLLRDVLVEPEPVLRVAQSLVSSTVLSLASPYPLCVRRLKAFSEKVLAPGAERRVGTSTCTTVRLPGPRGEQEPYEQDGEQGPLVGARGRTSFGASVGRQAARRRVTGKGGPFISFSPSGAKFHGISVVRATIWTAPGARSGRANDTDGMG